MEILLKSERLVKCRSHHETSTTVLSDNDNVMPMIYTQVYMAFEKSVESDRLIDALATVLEKYPELAGSMEPGADGGLKVVCDNSGALFQTAEASCSLSTLKNVHFAQADLPNGLVFMPADGRLLCVRCTQFPDGGMVVGITMHHSLADGNGTFTFIQNYAAIAKGEQIADPTSDRDRLFGRKDVIVKFDHTEYKIMPTVVTGAQPPPKLPDMAARNFYFRSEKLDQLKADISQLYSTLPDAPNALSTNDALCGLILRCVTKGEQVDHKRAVNLGMAVDGRSRLEPPLPATYFGNVNFFATASIPVSEMVRSHDGLAVAAKSVRKAVDRMDSDYMHDALNWVAQQKDKSKIIPGFDGFFGDDLAATSWLHFPMYSIDFGSGRPIQVGIPAQKFKGLAIIMPVSPDSEYRLVVTLGTTVIAMLALLCDAEFMKYAEVL